jgi:hypothetical protein
MNFLPSLFAEPSLVFIFIVVIFILSAVFTYQLFCAMALVKNTQKRLDSTENKLTCLTKNTTLNNMLNIALINSSQTKNNIELCRLLLDSCTHKSDTLSAKAVENSLHTEINHAVTAINALEEKRGFLEGKIRQAVEEIKLKTSVVELEQNLAYIHILLEESNLEFASTEQIKLDVFKVNRVLDSILLKI